MLKLRGTLTLEDGSTVTDADVFVEQTTEFEDGRIKAMLRFEGDQFSIAREYELTKQGNAPLVTPATLIQMIKNIDPKFEEETGNGKAK